MSRPSREDIHMTTALVWGQRSLCKRLQVGCVITSENMKQILAIGYNGPARHLAHDRCREELPGDCGCLHAEDNAIAAVNSTIPDKIMFTTTIPCEMCAQRIVNAGIGQVIYINDYRLTIGKEILEQCGVLVKKIPLPALAVR